MRHNLNPELYGNYIGVVINKDDPENRCRVQVFIPHLSTTLYENWNKDLKDITIKQGSLDGIPTAVKQRLIEILPWAEAALPLIGPGGSTYADKATDSTRLTNQAPSYIPMTGFKDVRGTGVSDPFGGSGTTISTGAVGAVANTAISQVGANGYSDAALHYALRIMAAESGVGTNMSPSQIASQINNADVAIALSLANALGFGGQYNAATGAAIRNSPGYNPNKVDIGYAQFNTENVNSKAFAGATNSGTFYDQATSFARFVQSQADKNPEFKSLLSQGRYEEAEKAARMVAGKPKAGAGLLEYYDETWGNNKRSINRQQNRAQFEADLAKNYGGDVNKALQAYSNKYQATPDAKTLLDPNYKYNPSNPNNNNSVSTTAAGDVNNIARHHDQVPLNGSMSAISPQGSFSVPLEGSFVWVFFMGGDINRPNYFGYVAEPNCGSRVGPGAGGGRFGNGSLISGGASSTTEVGTPNSGKAIPFEGAKLPELTPEQLAAKKVQANGTVTVPLYVNGKLNYGASVNIETARNFQGFVNALTEGGYKINSIGGFSDRPVRGGSAPSWHSTGNAIDINENANPMLAYLKTDLPSNISQIAAAYGLGWGGDWHSKKDAMHFSAGVDEGGKLMPTSARYPVRR